jgi:hypothetical protein
LGDELYIELLKTESSLCRGCQERGDKEDTDDGSKEDLGVPLGESEAVATSVHCKKKKVRLFLLNLRK